MAREKIAFETKANVNEVAIAVADGKTIRVTSQAAFETADPAEIAALDANDGLKRAEGKSRKDG